MSNDQSPLPANDPRLVAFKELQETPEYQNAVKWAIRATGPDAVHGELWFAFLEGWKAAYDHELNEARP